MLSRAFIGGVVLVLLSLHLQSWAQTVTATRTLAFGKFVAQAGGSVTVNPAGARSASGSVLLIGSGPGSSAEFQISDSDPNNAFRSIIIGLPADGTVTLGGASGSMAVNGFTSEPAETGTLSAGALTIRVGATLSVAANQPPGNYSGTFPIIINYQ